MPTSWASSEAVRRTMLGCKSRDTRPELRLRSEVHRLGLRYRVSARPIPGLRRTADLVFRPSRVAVFLDGCYWHGCPLHYREPKSNAGYWGAKIENNRRRDRETDLILEDAGWTTVRVWEHDDPSTAARRVADIVQGIRAAQHAAGDRAVSRRRSG